MKTKICPECSVEFRKRNDQVFCSRRCVSVSTMKKLHKENPQDGINNPNWKGGSKKSTMRHRLKFPEKILARKKVSNALISGRLIKQPCEVCGEQKSDAHHDDYSKPLEVRWLCRKHHAEHHKNKRILSPLMIA